MGVTLWLASLLPLFIPLAAWLLLNRRDRLRMVARSKDRLGGEAEDSSQPPPLVSKVVGAFSAGGAIGASAKSRLVKDVLLGEHECVLFAYLEELHGRDQPWGHVLDAGTGSHSLGWLAALDSSSLTAVTGDQHMLRDMQSQFRGKLRAQDELVIGNWRDDDFLKGRTFDVIVADYLLGALEGFAPYYQHKLLRRLKRHLKPGGMLFFVGTEPIPEKASTAAAQLICDVWRLRDAAILLGSDRRRPYREYPQSWVLEHAAPDYRVIGSGSFPIVYGPRTVSRQLGVARRKLPLMEGEVREGMSQLIESMEVRIAATDWRGVRLGEDYAIGFVAKEASPKELLEERRE